MQTIVIERDILKDRIISVEEFKALIDYLKGWNFKYYILVSLLAFTGARPCEVQALKLDDLSADNASVKVSIRKPKRYVKTGPNGAYNQIVKKYVWRPLPIWFLEDLTQYIKDTRRAGPYLFPADKYGAAQTSIHAQFKKIRDHLYSLGWEWVKDIYQQFGCNGKIRKYYRLSPYALRKFHAVEYLKSRQDKGVNAIVETSRHMGHNDIKTTLRYLALAINDRQNMDQDGFFNYNSPQNNILEVIMQLNERIKKIEEIIAS
jgi:integrase